MSPAGPERERLMGADLRLADRARGFDLVAEGGGDLAIAAGPDNMEQALRLRLLVRRGELAPLGWPDYGSRIHELIGQPNNQRTRTILMAHARAAILADPRVARIAALQARALPGERDTIQLDMEIEIISAAAPLNLVFDVRLEAV
jgi:phage baseplate assembly protein W